MEIVVRTPEKLIMRTDIPYSLANAIRRSVEEIQTLAIEDVEIFKNDSALYDEIVAHRLGLVPIKTDAKAGAKTTVEFKLKKVGPCYVYSGDMQGETKIPYDKIPITLLEAGQEIEIVATASMGNGVMHAKYTPGLMYYRHLSIVEAGNAKIDSIVQTVKGSIKPEKKGSSWVCDLNDAQIDEVKALNKEALKDSNELLLFVESFGHLDADRILMKAIEGLQENIDAFGEHFK